VVVGVCVGEDRFKPATAIDKELDLRCVLGYTPLEFRDSLHMLAEGEVDPRPLVTGEVGLEGVETPFGALGDPERHARILIDRAARRPGGAGLARGGHPDSAKAPRPGTSRSPPRCPRSPRRGPPRRPSRHRRRSVAILAALLPRRLESLTHA